MQLNETNDRQRETWGETRHEHCSLSATRSSMILSMSHVSLLRAQFPILDERIDGHALIYLDNAATTQKPIAVLSAMDEYYRHSNANINRGMHVLSERATIAYESARTCIQSLLNAKRREEIIFTRSATEGINLVARSFGEQMPEGSTIILTPLEHHANIVPWLQLKERKNIHLAWARCDEAGTIDLPHLTSLLERGNVSLVCVTGMSNVLGVRTPIADIVHRAHEYGARSLIDAAQLAAHQVIDVQALGCDVLVFSGHKLYGPTGIGVLYGREDVLSSMPPFLGGGDMIETVTEEGFTPAELPRRFEAGTPPIAEAVGLAAAIDWLMPIREKMWEHEASVLAYAAESLPKVSGLRILGPGSNYRSCISFTIDGLHPHDISEVLGRSGICLRSGHHCAQILHRRLGLSASTRLSVGAYNTHAEIDACIEALEKAKRKLG